MGTSCFSESFLPDLCFKIWASLLWKYRSDKGMPYNQFDTACHNIISFLMIWYMVLCNAVVVILPGVFISVIYLLDINWFRLYLYFPLAFFPLQDVYLLSCLAIFIMLEICVFTNNFLNYWTFIALCRNCYRTEPSFQVLYVFSLSLERH